jgi:hypothetical protein
MMLLMLKKLHANDGALVLMSSYSGTGAFIFIGLHGS